ncbi:MAG: FAD-dependent oxidoreductase [Verrucomicrobia subdivision 3 bacterium]|nr:FAD-dependent oxidoreductase [Limisphaerales bacterium]
MKAAVDIVVVGGGAAGVAAAVCAARSGRSTLLLDRRPAAGGTGGFSGLTTLCGLYNDAGESLNDGFVREFTQALGQNAPVHMGRVWVLPYRPEKFCEVATRLLAATRNLQTRWNAPLTDAIVENSRIVSLNGFTVGAVIDCTGSAEVARLTGVKCLATDETTQSPAVVFPLCNVSRDLDSPAAVAQVLLPLARAGFPPLNLQASLEANTLTAKFTGRAEQVPEVIAFLQRNVSGFENCRTPLTEFPSVSRAGRMIIGQYLLTGSDVLAGRKFPDGIAQCAWPVEQWGPDGVARFKYLPAGTHYEIPARSLRAAGVANLFMAGKTISAEVDAIASARVMGCCLATGAAAGVLAARHLESSPTR